MWLKLYNKPSPSKSPFFFRWDSNHQKWGGKHGIFLTTLSVFPVSGVGKCPKWTSPKYWGYNLQQIFESDVQNSQNGTFTKPWVSLDKTWQNETPKQRIWCPGATDGMAMAMAMTWEVGVRKKERPESKHWKTLEPNLIHVYLFSSICRNPKSDMNRYDISPIFPHFFPEKMATLFGVSRWFSMVTVILFPATDHHPMKGTGVRVGHRRET